MLISPPAVLGGHLWMEGDLKDQASWWLTLGLILLLPNYQKNVVQEDTPFLRADACWRTVRDVMLFPLMQRSWWGEASSEALGGDGPEGGRCMLTGV